MRRKYRSPVIGVESTGKLKRLVEFLNRKPWAPRNQILEQRAVNGTKIWSEISEKDVKDSVSKRNFKTTSIRVHSVVVDGRTLFHGFRFLPNFFHNVFQTAPFCVHRMCSDSL